MNANRIEDIYPLSPLQKSMFFASRLQPDSNGYLVQLCWTLGGDLDEEAFCRAWNEVVSRNSVLRTEFAWEGLDEPVAIVYRRCPIRFETADWRGMSPAESERALEELLVADRGKPLDLSVAPLARFRLLRVADDRHHFVWTFHHIILDGWSLGVVLKEVFAFYEAFSRGESLSLERTRPYRDYVAWLQEQDPATADRFWRRLLKGFTSVNEVSGSAGPGAEGERYAEVHAALTPELDAAVSTLARTARVTPNTIFQGLWAMAVARESGDDDVVFGATVSGRPSGMSGFESMVGLFINTLPVRATIPRDVSFLAWLAELQAQGVEARQYEYSPPVVIQASSEMARGQALYQSLLVFENFPFDRGIKKPTQGLAIVGVRFWTHTGLPLHLRVRPTPGLHLDLTYDASRFSEEKARSILLYLQEALAMAARDAKSSCADILLAGTPGEARPARSMLPPRAGHEVPPSPGSGETVASRFRSIAARHDERVAIALPESEITYRELESWVSVVASRIEEHAGPSDRVALLFGHDASMVAAVLGALEAGAAYVPLDPHHPVDRLRALLEDAEPACLLTNEANRTLAEALANGRDELPVVVVERSSDARVGLSRRVSRAAPESLAYILYTSGSTGHPKGVMQSQRNLLHHAGTYIRNLGIAPDDRSSLLSTYSFDAAVMDIFGALLSGATLCPFDVKERGFLPLRAWIAERGITLFHSTPTVYRYFLSTLGPDARFPSVRYVVMGGEEVLRSDLVAFERHFDRDAVFVNGLGPTESTLSFQYFHRAQSTSGEMSGVATVPVGDPVDETELWLLGESGERNALVGEIGIRSPYVALGYWRRPEETRSSFLPDPEGGERRIYRTGDMGRLRADGLLEFVGRKDFLLKIRGHRVETGEIESLLREHPAVREAVVVAREGKGGENRLVAFWVSEGPAPSESQLRAALRERLPDYMIPSRFVALDSLPLTPTGKIDRRALPEVPDSAGERERRYVEPRTPAEELVAGVFMEVLDVDDVGAEDDFFDRGGHSLHAAQVASRLAVAFERELPLRVLFERPTVADLAAWLESRAREGAPEGALEPFGIPRSEASSNGEAPLSYSQQRLWFLDRFAPGDPTYHIVTALRLSGELDLPALGSSLSAIAERHEALRTRFVEREEKPTQEVLPPRRIDPELVDLASTPVVEREREARRVARAFTDRAFDLSRGHLFDVLVVRLGEKDHLLVVKMHHIVSDAWSLGVLTTELSVLYRSFTSAADASLPPLPLQYADFARWQREPRREGALAKDLAYWKDRLSGELPVLELPTRSATAPTEGALDGDDAGAGAGAIESTYLDPELTARFKGLARGEDATLFMALVASFKALLYRLTGQTDLLLGTTTAGRPSPELEPLIGFFVNTLVLRSDLSGNPSFRDLLANVRATALDAYAHQALPFEKLVEELSPERRLDVNPLFQVMFVLQNAPRGALDLGGLQARAFPLPRNAAHFDLTLSIVDYGEGLLIATEYRRDRLERRFVAEMLERWKTILAAVAEEPETSLTELPLLSEKERAAVLAMGRGKASAYPSDSTIPDLFALAVARFPDRTAVRYRGEDLSYADLDRRAERLASWLRERGVGPEVLVGLALPRSFELAVSLVAIAKAGGAYLPLDPSYPGSRLAFLLQDAGARLLLTGSSSSSPIDTDAVVLDGVSVIAVDRVEAELPADLDRPERPSTPTPESLLYVCYTSGSTGRPKGVEVTHRAVVRLLFGVDYAEFGPEERILQLAPTAFDASTFEIWGALLHGGTLVLQDGDVPAPRELGKVLRRERITTLWLTSSLFNTVIDEEPEALRSVRRLLVGGETLSVPHIRRALEHLPETELVNGYGPTEGTTFTCCYRIPRWLPESDSVPLGPPIANTTVYLLDDALSLVPPGVAGELFIGGQGVARGYLRRPDWTAERFVPDPFASEPGARLYRTGDRARFLPGGELQFLGRRDHQVKLRGFRVELGEIESTLESHADVRQAVAVLRDDLPGGRGIVAYVVLADVPGVDIDLRGFLARKLPEFMIPAAVVTLARWPLTESGKVDRKALPAPALTGASATSGDLRSPRGPIERALAAIWTELLGRPSISRDDDFFALGGHSLLAARLVSRVRRTLDVEVPLRSVFESPTLEALARRVEEATPGRELGTSVPMERRDASAPAPASFAQERLWFLQQVEPESSAYHITAAVRLDGRLHVEALVLSLEDIVDRQDSLSTTFTGGDGGVVQVVDASLRPSFAVVDLSGAPAGRRHEEALCAARARAREPFRLAVESPLRALLVRFRENEHVLVITMHHIVSDGWSLGIFVRELGAFYDARVAGAKASLPPLPISYRDYAAWQRETLSGERLERLRTYWREQLVGAAPLELPSSVTGVGGGRGGGRAFRQLPPGVGSAIVELGRACGVTPFMTLLAAFQLLLHRYSGQDDITIGTPIANRDRAEIEGVIGLFVNLLPLRIRLAPGVTFRELLLQVKETTLGAYAHQDLPFERMVAELGPQRQDARNPLFEVTFTLQNTPSAKLELSGLTLSPFELPVGRPRFELETFVWEQAGTYVAAMSYDESRFSRPAVEALVGRYAHIVETALCAPDTPLDELPMLTASERERVLFGWNPKETSFPRDRTLQESFELVARNHGDAVAVEWEGSQLSYGELDRRANRLAHRLRELGVGRESIVGIAAERSPEAVVALLAIAKARGAYLPLDPRHPTERLLWMLDNAGASVLIVHDDLADRFGAFTGTRVPLEGWAEGSWELTDDDPPDEASASAEDLCYVIYTSGSTGVPKGVAVSHRAVHRLVRDTNYIQLGPGARVAQASNLAFDAATFEIWGALLTGATLVGIPPEVVLSPPALVRSVERDRISVMFLTTALFNQVARERPDGFSSLDCLLFGGEAADPGAVREVLATKPPQRLLHVYGPTESTTFATFHPVEGLALAARTVPIGLPIANTTAYVVDRSGQPVPAGVPGELLLGGEGLARGYFHAPELTAERFIPDAFGPAGGRLYRTGDVVRRLETGDVEFLGRLDQQVKLRGFRIELAEVEAVLSRHPGIQRAVVVLREDQPGDSRLVGYLVVNGGPRPDGPALLEYLRAKLPEYMVPSSFALLESLPLNANGKIDRGKLPFPAELETLSLGSGSAPPRSRLETLIATEWSDVLGVESPGRHDNFFDLGGHSLLVLRLHKQLRQHPELSELAIVHLFQCPTIAALADFVSREGQNGPELQRESAPSRDRDEIRSAELNKGRRRLARQLEARRGLEAPKEAEKA